MSNQKNMTVNQHYISQGLISLFSENKKYVFEYNVQTGKTYRAAIRKTMSGKKIYEHSSLPGNTLEKFFKTIEDDYIPAIKSVVALLDKNRIEDAKKAIKSLLPSFLLFYYRSGAILYELGYQNNLMQEQIVNKMLGRVSNYSYLNRLSNAIINDYKLVVVKNNKNGFGLSDQYISTASLDCKGKIANMSNRTIGFINCLIMLPISSKYYALFYNGRLSLKGLLYEKGILEIDDDDLLLLNKVIIRNSYTKCVAMHESDLSDVSKYKSTCDNPTNVLIHHSDESFSEYETKKEVFFYDIDLEIFNMYPQYISNLQQFKEKHKRNISRNDLCLCGSGKKYKKCCMDKYKESQRIFQRIMLKDSSWMCTPSNCVEYPIYSFWGTKDELSSKSKEIIKAKKIIKEDCLLH